MKVHERPVTAQLAQAPGRCLRRATILLVDDYEPNLIALEATLQPVDANFIKVASGEEALERVHDQELALILLDIRMRGIDGIETAARINASHGGREVPIILLTAYELSEENLRRAYTGGVVDVIRKPLLPEIMRAKALVFVELFLQRDEIRRQQAALQLRQKESEDLLQLIVEQSGEGIIVQDERGVLRIFNPAAQQQHGGAERDLLEGSPLGRAVRGEEVRDAEWTVRRPDGASRVLTGTASPLLRVDGSSAGAVLITRDVTKRKRAEACQAFMVEASELLGSTLDYEGTLSALAHIAVPRMADWCAIDIIESDGETRRLPLVHSDPDRAREPPDLHPAWAVQNVLKTGTSEWVPNISEALLASEAHDTKHLRRLTALGLRSFIIVPLTARQRTHGALTLVHADSGRVYDEADLRLAEDLARRAGLFLDNALLYREAQNKSERLERSNRDLDQFAYIASHDLKAPLRGITNLSQWLEEDLGPSLPEESKSHLELLRGRARRMEALIDAILAYSRAGRVKGRDEPVDVRALLEDVIELLSSEEVRVSFGEMPTLVTERVLLQQVFMNLIGNAIKHGGRRDLEVRIELTDRGSHYEFAVIDNGVGIAPEYQEKIWGVFQTLVRRDEVEGTGIGLAVVKKLVELSGGRVWVESQPGGGATFRFTWRKQRARGFSYE